MMQMQVLLNAVPQEVGVQNSVPSNSGKKGGVGSETSSNAFQEKLGEKLKDCESPVDQVPSDEQQVVQPMLKDDGGAEKSSQQKAIAEGEVDSKSTSDKQAAKTPAAQETTNASGKEKLALENTQTSPDRSTAQLNRILNAVQDQKTVTKDVP
ncbi:MAG: hypothetical protein GY852_08645, partial [bacterium]|nr:hypothetical protein [bacterium]